MHSTTCFNQSRTPVKAVEGHYQKSAFLINRKIVNTAIGRDVGEALAAYALPVLQTAIAQRVAFAEAAATGQTVLETDAHGLAAQKSMPGSRLELLPNAGHFPQLEEPLRVARILTDFMESTEPARLVADDLRDQVLAS